MSHGGKREGAGRKPGSGSGRTKKRSQLSMSPEAWEKLKRISGGNMSAWVENKVKTASDK